MSGRERILRAAFDLFSAKGFAAVGIREIADRAGLSNPALYQHFEGKEALGLEVYSQCYDALLCEVDARITSESDELSRLCAYVDAAVKLHQRTPSPLLFLEDEQRTFYAAMKARHGEKIISRQITEWIASGQKSGIILSDLPARMLAAAVIGQITKWAAMSSFGLAPTRGASKYLKHMMRSVLSVPNNLNGEL